MNYVFKKKALLISLLILLPVYSFAGLFPKDKTLAIEDIDSLPFLAHFKFDLNNIDLNSDKDEHLIEVKISPFVKIDKFYFLLEFPFQLSAGGTIYNSYTYQHPSNYLQFINTIGYGRKDKDPFFFKIGSLSDITFGAGSLVSDFRNDLYLPQMRNVGLYLNLSYQYAGVDFFTSSISSFNLSGTRLFINPLAFLDSSNVFSKTQLGVSFVYDIDNHQDIYSSPNVINLAKKNSDSDEIFVYSVDAKIPFFQTRNKKLVLGLNIEHDGVISQQQNSLYTSFFLDYKFYHLDTGLAYLQNGFVFGFFSPLYLQTDIRKNKINRYDGDALGYSFNNAFTFFDKKLTMKLDTYGQTQGSFSYNVDLQLRPFLLSSFAMDIGFAKEDCHSFGQIFDVYDGISNSLIFLQGSYLITDNVRLLLMYRKDFDVTDKNEPFNNDLIEFKVSFYL